MPSLPDVGGLPVLDPLDEVADLAVTVVALDAGLAVHDPVVVVHLDAVAVGCEDRRLALELVVNHHISDKLREMKFGELSTI